MTLSDRTLKLMMTCMAGIIFTLAVLVSILVAKGDIAMETGSVEPLATSISQPVAVSKPVVVSQPASAAAVARQLNCVRFHDNGPSELGGSIDSGICWMHGEKYGVNTFASQTARDGWLKLAEPLGTNPTWETRTAVAYVASDQSNSDN
jgi:hypothetical protein